MMRKEKRPSIEASGRPYVTQPTAHPVSRSKVPTYIREAVNYGFRAGYHSYLAGTAAAITEEMVVLACKTSAARNNERFGASEEHLALACFRATRSQWSS